MSEQRTITVNITRTINLGDYENVKIEIGETLPVSFEATDEMCEEAIKDLADTLARILKEKSKEYTKFLKSKNKN